MTAEQVCRRFKKTGTGKTGKKAGKREIFQKHFYIYIHY
jgi:ribosomal protein L35